MPFTVTDVSPVAAVVDELLAAAAGGWVNLQPDLDEEPELASPLTRLFGARGPVVPLATIVAPDDTGRRPVPGSIGLEHPAGTRALAQLAEWGLRPPADWVRRQDHPRRGIVLEYPAGTSGTELVEFLVRAAAVLSPEGTGARWVAAVYRPR